MLLLETKVSVVFSCSTTWQHAANTVFSYSSQHPLKITFFTRQSLFVLDRENKQCVALSMKCPSHRFLRFRKPLAYPWKLMGGWCISAHAEKVNLRFSLHWYVITVNGVMISTEQTSSPVTKRSWRWLSTQPNRARDSLQLPPKTLVLLSPTGEIPSWTTSSGNLEHTA